MIKVTATLRTGFFAIVGLLALVPFAFANTAPTLTILPQVTTATSTTYAIILTNNGDIFNVVEFELLFASGTQLKPVSIESELCRPEFAIENNLKLETGSWYVACGTFLPFSGASTTIATFTITNPSPAPSFNFGKSTSLYRHDGLGRQITPLFITDTKIPLVNANE
jgi:hypothetical protein